MVNNKEMSKGIEVTIPKSLDDITYEQYVKFSKLTSGDLPEATIIELMITTFCNVSLNDIKLLKQKHISDIVSRLGPVLEMIGSENTPLKHRFFVGDVEFGFITKKESIT